MKFISKRCNISFNGCAFKHFSFQTEDEAKIKLLRSHFGYGNDFIELGAKDNSLGKLTPEEINSIIERRKHSEEVEFEKVEEIQEMEKMITDTKKNTNLFDVDVEEVGTKYTMKDDYEELKTEAKAKGMEWKGFPKKKDLIEFLNE